MMLLAIITVAGTFIHHIVDYIIAVIIGSALAKAKAIRKLPPILEKIIRTKYKAKLAGFFSV